MKTQQTIKHLKNFIKTNKDGFTLKYSTLKPIKKFKGYCVSITNLKGISLKPLIKQILITAKSFKQIHKNLYVGGWFNNENKTFYLDLTLIIDNEQTARQTAQLFNQIAIFNLNTFQEIKL